MKKIIATSIIAIFILSTIVLATMTPYDTQTDEGVKYTVEQSVDKGWNLLTCFLPNTISADSGIQKDNIKVIWMYINILNQYYQSYPENELGEIPVEISRNLDENQLLATACWVYSEKKGTIKYITPERIPNLEDRQINRGWNFVSITPEMTNPENAPIAEQFGLKDIEGTCNIQKSYVFDFEEQEWFDFPVEEELYSHAEGMGWLIKVPEDCHLKSREEGGVSTSPPGLPGTSTKCKDTDGGNNYYVRGTASGIKLGADYFETYEDECLTDNSDGYNLKESFCKNNQVTFEFYNCPNGCNKGVCVK